VVLYVSSRDDPNNPDIQITYSPDDQHISFGFALQWSHTTGYVRLASKNPNIPADVQLHDPLDPRDIDSLVWAINFARGLARVPPFSEIIDQEMSPGTNLTEQEIRAWIIQHVFGYNHYTGTCALGDATFPNAVVNTSLFVKNVQNLRVADASVLLHSGNGNIQNSVLAVGEIASDLILGRK